MNGDEILLSIFKGSAMTSIGAIVVAGLLALVSLIALAVMERGERADSPRMRYGHVMTLGESVYGWAAARSDDMRWVAEFVAAPGWVFRTVCVPLAFASWAMIVVYLTSVILDKYRANVAGPSREFIRNMGKEETPSGPLDSVKGAVAEAAERGMGMLSSIGSFFSGKAEGSGDGNGLLGKLGGIASMLPWKKGAQTGGGFMDTVSVTMALLFVAVISSIAPTLEYIGRRYVVRATSTCRDRAIALLRTLFEELQKIGGLVVLGGGVHGKEGILARALESPQLMNDAVAEHPDNVSLAFVLAVAHWYRTGLGRSHPGFARLKETLMTPATSAFSLAPLVDLIPDPQAPPPLRPPAELTEALGADAFARLGDLQAEWDRVVGDVTTQALISHRTAKAYLGGVTGIGVTVAATTATAMWAFKK